MKQMLPGFAAHGEPPRQGKRVKRAAIHLCFMQKN
jgi:hypothetical protein